MNNKKFFAYLFVLAVPFLLLAASSNLTVDQILNRSFDATSETIQLSIATGTNKDVTALTNTPTYPLELEHETSGTPAAGIGVGVEFIQETADDNNETVAKIAAEMADVTATSEDAYLRFYTMTAGAAADERLILGPTECVFNDGSDDNNFRVESNGNQNAIFVDAGNDRVGIFTASPAVALDVTGAVKVSSNLAVDTDVLSVDATNDLVEINGFYDSPYQEVAAASYTVTSASKATYYVVNYTDTGAVNFCLDTDMTVDGRLIVVKDGELNANSNNITITTEGAETIDEADTYVMNAAGEAVMLISDGTNWFVVDGYKE